MKEILEKIKEYYREAAFFVEDNYILASAGFILGFVLGYWAG